MDEARRRTAPQARAGVSPGGYDADDPLFKPLTIAEVMARTGRSRKTVDRWIKSEQLRVVRLDDPPAVYAIERDVLELERQMRAKTRASKDAIAERGGRPGARPPSLPGAAT